MYADAVRRALRRAWVKDRPTASTRESYTPARLRWARALGCAGRARGFEDRGRIRLHRLRVGVTERIHTDRAVSYLPSQFAGLRARRAPGASRIWEAWKRCPSPCSASLISMVRPTAAAGFGPTCEPAAGGATPVSVRGWCGCLRLLPARPERRARAPRSSPAARRLVASASRSSDDIGACAMPRCSSRSDCTRARARSSYARPAFGRLAPTRASYLELMTAIRALHRGPVRKPARHRTRIPVPARPQRTSIVNPGKVAKKLSMGFDHGGLSADPAQSRGNAWTTTRERGFTGEVGESL